MEKLALLAKLEAKPGKEQEVADFIKSALPLAQAETGTVRWYALQLSDTTFGISSRQSKFFFYKRLSVCLGQPLLIQVEWNRFSYK